MNRTAVRLPILLAEDLTAMRPASRPVRAWLLAQAAVYALASWTTLKGALTTTDPVAATALDQGTSIPWLRELVLVVGLVLAGAGAILTPRGIRYGRGRDLVAAPRRLRPALLRLGRVGAVTRGIMFLLPGLILVAEAWSYRRGSFGHVSDSVRAALQQPWGRVLLVVAATGLAAFALYELAAAAYRREPPAPVLASRPPAARVRPWWTVTAMLVGAAAGFWSLLVVLGYLVEMPAPAPGRNADEAVAAWLADHRTPVLNQLSAVGTALATPMTGITVTAVVAVVLALWLGRWREPVVLVVAGTGQLLISVLVGATVDRMSPAVAQLDPTSSASSFPSRQMGAAVALYAGVAVIVLRELRAHHRRSGAALAAVLVAIPVLVGLSRIYRGINFPSDVLAAATAGAAWLAVVVAVVLVPGRYPRADPAPVAGRRPGVDA